MYIVNWEKAKGHKKEQNNQDIYSQMTASGGHPTGSPEKNGQTLNEDEEKLALQFKENIKKIK